MNATSQPGPADIVAHLRTLDTVDEGRAYLAQLGLDLADLEDVATASGVTRMTSAERRSAAKLQDKVLWLNITTRRRSEGLRKW